MSLHALDGPAAFDAVRLDLVERHRTAAGRGRAALAARWEPARDGNTLSARPQLRMRWKAVTTSPTT